MSLFFDLSSLASDLNAIDEYLSAQYGVLLILKAKRGWLVPHWIYVLDLISKNNLKFGLRQVSARKQFNLYFHRMFSSFPCGYDWEVSQFKDALRGKRWLWKKQNSVLSLTKETYIQCDSSSINMSLLDKMGRGKIVWTLSDSLLFAKK